MIFFKEITRDYSSINLSRTKILIPFPEISPNDIYPGERVLIRLPKSFSSRK